MNGRGYGRGKLMLQRRGGSTGWLLDYKDEHGTRQRRLLSRDKRTAERIANEVIQKRDLAVGGVASTEGQDLTLAEVRRQYLEHLASYSSRSHLRNCGQRIDRVLGGIPATRVRDLRVHHVLEHMQSRLGPRTGVRTVNHEAMNLKAMLNWAATAGVIAQNPLEKLKLLPVKEENLRRNRRALSDEEIERFLVAARDDDQVQASRCDALRTITTGSKGFNWDARDRRTRVPQFPLWLSFIETGGRYFELTHVRWADIDTVHATLTFRGSTTKNAKTRVIPLREHVVSELVALRQVHRRVLGRMPGGADPIFLNPEGELWAANSRGLLRILTRILDLARIDPKDADGRVIDVHALRHTCASRLARAGVPVTFTQKLLGHSTIELTSRFYTHTGLEEMRKALHSLDEADGEGKKYELRVV